MTKIYDQFDRAFQSVSAYLITGPEGQQIGRVALKHGNARLDCYFQIWGCEMVKGSAGGGGYDKASAAVRAAVAKIATDKSGPAFVIQHAFHNSNDGARWSSVIEAEGYTVQHVFG